MISHRVLTNVIMSKLFSKITKMCFYILLVSLFLSGTKLEEKPLLSSAISYDYTIEVSGGLSDHLSGVIDFESTIETTSKGIPFSTLNLKFDSSEEASHHSFEFLIAKENRNRILEVGTYKIISNKKGLLNYFDGVIGYVNIDTLGELPLFAKTGKINIYRLSKTEIEGSLDVELNNAGGQSVRIKGDFVAKEVNENLL